MSKSKLEKAIQVVNNRYAKGLNDDDQVKRMCDIDKTTKGYTFQPEYDYYRLCTDLERLQTLSDKHGYWSEQVKYFNTILAGKGGIEYMQELNNIVKPSNQAKAA